VKTVVKRAVPDVLQEHESNTRQAQTQPVEKNSQPQINPCPGSYMPLEPPQQYLNHLAYIHINVNSINDTSSKHIKPLCSSAAGEGTKDPFTKLSVILRQVWSAI